MAGLFGLLAVSLTASQSAETAPVRTLQDYHPFRALAEGQDWESRREEIARRVQIAAGLWPWPEKNPIEEWRGTPVEREGIQIFPIRFESFPGHFVTGSLFLPTGASLDHGLKNGRRPGVLCPYGHWEKGRFHDLLAQRGEAAVQEQITSGAEQFSTAARNPVIARCVQLARMGCIVFCYDMLGTADSIQFPEHRNGPRPGMSGSEPGSWGFNSPAALLRLQGNFGLQTWNSERALDYLLGLPEVDPDRIVVTGASGGATQTLAITGIDPRVDIAFPAVMVSTAMQGGCTCENAPYLRINQGNIDLAAAIAPRPLGLTAADDWTIELETKGHPDLLALYKKLEAPDHYEAHFNLQFKHNFNLVSRLQLYDFLNRHAELALTGAIEESEYAFLGPDELGVWKDGKPDSILSGDDHERDLNRVWAEDSAKQVEEALLQAKIGSVPAWLRDAWKTILSGESGVPRSATFSLGTKEASGDLIQFSGNVVCPSHPEVPVTMTYPKSWTGDVWIQLGSSGDETSAKALANGSAIITLVFPESGNPAQTYSGKDSEPADSWQRSPVYYYGYNDSTFVKRVHAVLATVAMVRQHPDWKVTSVSLAGRGEWAAVALAARVLGQGDISEAHIDLDGFRFAAIDDLWDNAMVPGAVKYGDVLGLAALNAPYAIIWTGESELGSTVQALYEGAGAAKSFQSAP